MDVKPLRAILILVLFLAIGGGAAYLSTRAATIQGPSDLSKDHNGTLYVRIHQKVFVYDKEGGHHSQFDIGPLGIKEVWSGFSFYSNGDLLISPSLLSDSSKSVDGPVLDRLNRCIPSTRPARLPAKHT